MSMNTKNIFSFKKEINDEEMSIVAYANKSDTIDRSGDLIDDSAWDMEKFLKNPVIPAFHDYRRPPVGKALWVKCIPGEGLRFKVKFANTDDGREFYNLYKDGILNAFSVGFIPKNWKTKDEFEKEDFKKYERNGKYPDTVYTEVELLEVSSVVVPDNASALIDRDEKGLIKTKGVKDFVARIKEDPEFIELDFDEKDFCQCGEDCKCKEVVTKPETTEKYHHIPVEDASKFDKDTLRTIDISKDEGIKAVVGKYNSANESDDPTHVQKYMFDKDKWSMEEAKEWVSENKKEITEDMKKDSKDDKNFKNLKEISDFEIEKFFDDNENFVIFPEGVWENIDEIKESDGDIFVKFIDEEKGLEKIKEYYDELLEEERGIDWEIEDVKDLDDVLEEEKEFDVFQMFGDNGDFKSVDEIPKHFFQHIEKMSFDKDGNINCFEMKETEQEKQNRKISEEIKKYDEQIKELKDVIKDLKEKVDNLNKEDEEDFLEIDIEQLGKSIQKTVDEYASNEEDEIDMSEIIEDAFKKATGKIF